MDSSGNQTVFTSGNNLNQPSFLAFTRPAAQPLDCSKAAPRVGILWPPNHQFVRVTITGVTDPDGEPVTTTITSIKQDEPTLEPGSGNFCPDASGVGTSTANLRAERDGQRDGRVYHVDFRSTDSEGTACTGEVKVCVPHDQSVVPKALRERLGLKPGTELEAFDQQDGMLLCTVEERPALVKVDGLWVHRGVAQPGANWDRIIQELREERVESVLKD
ncbi:MAG: AbrB/MazE/SpoVT family DNA-binding domain-containing protein [Deltaproteobacteria bacterium]|nr:AbrB/MazE/SpoVT family DNA-binding domain-containing protein [Deltaproteobacteria bacterium]